MMAVRCGDIDDVDIGVGDKLSVRAVCLGRARAADLLDELGSSVGRGRGGNGDNLMSNITHFSACRVGQEVLAEGYQLDY